MSSDDSSIHNLTLEQTNDIAMTIDDVLSDSTNMKIVEILTASNVERTLLLRELLMNAYIRGFFSGVHHKALDVEESKQSRN
jgi:hypothetical protein